MTTLVASALIRPLIEPRLPSGIDARWFSIKEEAFELAPQAEIGWFDMWDKRDMAQVISRATKLKWLNSIYAGVDGMPLELLRERGVIVTNGAGLLADAIAEFTVMGILSVAKGYHKIVQAQARREWLATPAGQMELGGSKALILGRGAIGAEIETRLKAFGVEIANVRRTPGPGDLGPEEWRARLGEFDWVIVAVPSTPDTRHMIGAAEFAAMKKGAAIINIARGAVIDQDAMIAALESGPLGHAFLDVTDPEPLPPESPLWGMENVQISMHLSGPSQSSMFQRAGKRFLENLARYRAGEPVQPQVNLALGY